jgi:hypothetical protein
MRLFTVLLAFALCNAVHALENHQDFERYSVHFNVFNSTFVPTQIAARHNIKRSKYESLINVSVSPLGKYGALPANISGTVTNLLQQKKPLKFIEIVEQDATYYLAPIRINGEEILHVELNVQPRESEDKLYVKFIQKVYSDE